MNKCQIYTSAQTAFDACHTHDLARTSDVFFHTIQSASAKYLFDLALANLLPFRIKRLKRITNPQDA